MQQWLLGMLSAIRHGGLLGSGLNTWLGMAALVAITGLIWAAWYLALCGFCRSAPYAMVASMLMTIAQIILSELGLGLIGLLYAPVVIGVNLVATGIVLLTRVVPKWGRVIEAQRQLLSQVRTIRLSLFGRAVLGLYLLVLLRSAFEGFFLAPREWDALVFHLPIMAEIYQAHAIRPFSSLVIWVRAYPFNVELLSLWNLLFLGVDKLVDIPSLPAIVTGALAVYGLSRRWGASRDAALAGACIFAFAPTMVLQQVSSHVDAFMASIFAMGVYLLFGASHAFDVKAKPAIVGLEVGLAAGILAGAKYTGLFYSLALGLLLLGWWLGSLKGTVASAGGRGWAWGAPRVVGPALVAVIALGAYPYLRNLYVFRNPIAPYEVSLLGHVVFQGQTGLDQFIANNSSPQLLAMPIPERLATTWLEKTGSLEDEFLAGLGPLWIILGVPALAAWLVSIILRRQWLQLLLCVLTFLALLATPAFWVPRYSVPVLLLGALAIGWLLDRLRPFARHATTILLLAMAALSVFLTMDLAQVTPRVLRDYVAWRDDRSRSSADFVWVGRKAFLYLEKETSVSPATIAYGGLVRFIYPLYGADLRNRVVAFRASDPHEWQEDLDHSGVEYVIAVKGKPEFTMTTEDPEFQEVASDGGVTVFKRR
ncbi:MAG: hypothetical protein ABSF61_05970 [Anaerolineales bacterium]|jgi:hypothetical protein